MLSILVIPNDSAAVFKYKTLYEESINVEQIVRYGQFILLINRTYMNQKQREC